MAYGYADHLMLAPAWSAPQESPLPDDGFSFQAPRQTMSTRKRDRQICSITYLLIRLLINSSSLRRTQNNINTTSTQNVTIALSSANAKSS